VRAARPTLRHALAPSRPGARRRHRQTARSVRERRPAVALPERLATALAEEAALRVLRRAQPLELAAVLLVQLAGRGALPRLSLCFRPRAPRSAASRPAVTRGPNHVERMRPAAAPAMVQSQRQVA
jgi:hypothetical protein